VSGSAAAGENHGRFMGLHKVLVPSGSVITC
jgi:hypothetical protein